MTYLNELSRINRSDHGVTRLYLTEEHKKANKLLKKWMTNAGMTTTIDAVGNLIGTYPSTIQQDKTLVIGSHQDSVINGGIYDGPLGIIAPLICVEELNRHNITLPYNLKIIAFGSEEGARFKQTYLTSSAYRGNLYERELINIKDDQGITLFDAMESFGLVPAKVDELEMDPTIANYLEMHIEQGPVLESLESPVGVVTAINGFRRYSVHIKGFAGHAGTLPMDMRKDALVGTSEIISYIEKRALAIDDLVATVGKIDIKPGSVNVVPDETTFTIDIRSSKDQHITNAMSDIKATIDDICQQRQLDYTIDKIVEDQPCYCDEEMINLISDSIAQQQLDVHQINSGAGHDAQEMSKSVPIGMIFVRCSDGISHNPKESVTVDDLDTSIKVLMEVIRNYN